MRVAVDDDEIGERFVQGLVWKEREEQEGNDLDEKDVS